MLYLVSFAIHLLFIPAKFDINVFEKARAGLELITITFRFQRSFYAINANIAIEKLIFVFQPSGVFDFDSIDSNAIVLAFLYFSSLYLFFINIDHAPAAHYITSLHSP